MFRSPFLGAIALALTASLMDARAQQRTFAYAPSSADDAVAVWQVEHGGAALRAAGTVRHPIGTRAPVEVVLHPSGTHAYVVHAPSAEHGGAISVHRIDHRTGRLEFRSVVLETTGSVALGLDPAGHRAYVVDAARASLRMFTLDADLERWRERHAPLPTGSGPCQLLIDPRGRFLFVLNRELCSVSRYRLDADGRPELSGEDVLLNGSRPARALLDPAGARLFVSLETYDVLLSMSVDARDGALRTINAAGTGSAPCGLALNTNGDRVFVAERGGGSVSAFDIDPRTGQLGARLGPFPAGTAPTDVVRAADGRTIWVTGEGHELRSFAIDGHTAAIPGLTRRASGPLGPLAGLAQEVTRGVAHVALAVHEDGLLSARPGARGAFAPIRSHLGAPAWTTEQVVGPLETSDELVVDPFGTWILALCHRPGRFALVTVDTRGRLGEGSEVVSVGPEVAGAAVAPDGCLVAVATRTPAAVHTYLVLDGAVQHLHSLPLSAAPDALVFDSTGRSLFLSHTAANRLTAIALDEAGYMVRSTSGPLPGGPGPLALAPEGDVLFVGLRSTPGVVPCSVGARSEDPVVMTGLGVELPLPPTRLALDPTGHTLHAVFARDDQKVRIERHPATGALSLRASSVAPGPDAGPDAGIGRGPAPCATARGSRGADAGDGRSAVRVTAMLELALPWPCDTDQPARSPRPAPGAEWASDASPARAARAMWSSPDPSAQEVPLQLAPPQPDGDPGCSPNPVRVR